VIDEWSEESPGLRLGFSIETSNSSSSFLEVCLLTRKSMTFSENDELISVSSRAGVGGFLLADGSFPSKDNAPIPQ
jgi:hypothetical protein